MTNRQYNFWVYRVLCLLMALHLVNLSVDVQDMMPLTGRMTVSDEKLSVNKIESISEFLLEECFGIQDAVPEHDDPDDESELTEQEQDYDFNQLFVFAPLRAVVQFLLTGNVSFWPEPVSVHVQEIIAPPPQPTI
ncbi:hypothetical protein [Spirosoma validum]|uniref:Uncharacterized protein n=1 Tax=Spirosoma validum TaxID=2771355 RepID=A0A927GEA7_9BACT|nr:hypothetical protein [Spirosoma validum]MBD2754435.1 hypothetical protein [Spirosoma validum]